MIALLAHPAGRWLALAVVGAGIAGGLYLKGRGDGREACEARAAVAAARERDRQHRANDAALAAARERIETLIRERQALEDTLEAIGHEARDDPAAAGCGVTADGVRRLNRVR